MKVALIGGRGFFGSAVANQLREQGVQVRTIDRSEGPENHVQASILDTRALTKAVSGCDAVVNFVGLTPVRQPRTVSYEQIHIDGAASAALACEQAGVSLLVHISALGASMQATTKYLRTKAAGESAIEVFSGSRLVVRPSILVDVDNELIQMLRKASVTRLFVRTTGMLQPVYRQDAAHLIADAILSQRTGVVELGGPDVCTLSDLARLVYSTMDRKCFLLPLWLARLGATTLAILPRTGIGFDQVRSLSLHNALVPNKEVDQVVLDTSVRDWLDN